MSIEIQLANGQKTTVETGAEALEFLERAQTRPNKPKKRRRKKKVKDTVQPKEAE